MISERPLQKLVILIGFCISKILGGINAGKSCSIQLLDGGCSETETCVVAELQQKGVCDCLPGYNRTNDGCVVTTRNADIVNESHSLAWTFFILILIAIVIVFVYFIYKLRVVDWVRCKLSQRYNRSYDDVMIGQDDE